MVWLAQVRELYVEYLKYDEGGRLELLENVRDYVKEFLTETTAVKFSIPLFMDLLESNMTNRNDFSPSGTAQAFEALEKYATNILTAPWRKEFHTIKLFGGFYKHKVDKHLHGAEKILHMIGYQFKDDQTLILRDIRKDQILEVGLNCLLASCECELLQDFYIAVKKSGLKCGYKKIVTLKNNLANKDTHRFTTKSTSRDINNHSTISNGHYDGNRYKTEVRVDQLIDVSDGSAKKINLRSDDTYEKVNKRDALARSEDLYEKVQKRDKLQLQTQASKTGTSLKNKKQKGNTTGDLLQPDTFDNHIQASISAVKDQQTASNNLDRPATRADTWNYVDQKLTESNAILPPTEFRQADEMAARKQHEPYSSMNLQHSQGDANLIHFGAKVPSYMPAYPYANFTLMYPTIAHPMAAFAPPYLYTGDPTNYTVVPPYATDPAYNDWTTSSQAAVQMRNLDLQDTARNGSARGYQEAAAVHRRSHYDNVSGKQAQDKDPDLPANCLTNNKYHDDSGPLPSPPPPFDDDSLVEADSGTMSSHSTDDRKRTVTKSKKEQERNGRDKKSTLSNAAAANGNGSSNRSSMSSSFDGETWQCSSCTVMNKANNEICSVCSRSKTMAAEPIPPGGRECPFCTLINEKNVKHCAACNHRLPDHASTYV